uniref:Tabinhibitin 9 n=1 Tax=Tabanus yao TaxID=485572 RepID=INH9_TABYA|nr:RecName: Full=Tabinhibitin 9; Flags: Precursor [Tabanus yao]ACT33296.1 putative tabinhibitin 9 [Tabanus yao]
MTSNLYYVLISPYSLAYMVQYRSVTTAAGECRGDMWAVCARISSDVTCARHANLQRSIRRCFYIRSTMCEIMLLRDHGDYPVASRMKVIVWDEELAALAKRHTQGCVPEAYKCRHTLRFWTPGQLNFEFYADKMPFTMSLISTAIKRGHMQKHNITRDIVEKYQPVGPKGNVKELALAIFDRVTAVGCGLTTWKLGGKARAFFTCNFFSENDYNRPVYKTGNSPGEKCIKKDETFKNLCFAQEPINPNEHNL